jgi:hypothetical protein
MLPRKQIAALTVPANDRVFRIRDVNYFGVPRNIAVAGYGVIVACT